jgi:hypothetical protein
MTVIICLNDRDAKRCETQTCLTCRITLGNINTTFHHHICRNRGIKAVRCGPCRGCGNKAVSSGGHSRISSAGRRSLQNFQLLVKYVALFDPWLFVRYTLKTNAGTHASQNG